MSCRFVIPADAYLCLRAMTGSPPQARHNSIEEWWQNVSRIVSEVSWTPFGGKVHGFSDDVAGGTAPLVEFSEDAFEVVRPAWAHSKWETFDLGLSSKCAKFSVMTTPAGQTFQLTKMIWALPHCISLWIGRSLTLCQFCEKVLDKVCQNHMFSAKGVV